MNARRAKLTIRSGLRFITHTIINTRQATIIPIKIILSINPLPFHKTAMATVYKLIHFYTSCVQFMHRIKEKPSVFLCQ